MTALYHVLGGVERRKGRPDRSSRVFPTAAWLWNPIPANPAIDVNSAAMITSLTTTPGQTNKGISAYQYSTPIYEIPLGATVPTYSVPCTSPYAVARTVTGVPIPTDVSPALGSPSSSDGHMVLIDRRTGLLWEFYDLYWTGTGWSTGDLTVHNYATSDGRQGTRTADPASGANSGVIGCGFSRFAGIVRREELEAAWPNGVIPHALVGPTSIAAPTVLRYPAVKTDGSNMDGAANPIPEGARLQLSPTVNVEALAVTTFEKIIARTLQQYGWYPIDNGGSRVAIQIQGNDPALDTPPTDPGNPTAVGGWLRNLAGVTNQYALLNLPWDQMRVLASWNGA